jgi:hypothetical protein
VFEAGAADTGRPGFVMERVKETEYGDAHERSTEE